MKSPLPLHIFQHCIISIVLVSFSRDLVIQAQIEAQGNGHINFIL